MRDDKIILKVPHDPGRISLSEDYEVRYWCEKFGVTEKELVAAVTKVGNTRDAVENELAWTMSNIIKSESIALQRTIRTGINAEEAFQRRINRDEQG
jgi:hypothetical protein